MGQTDTRDGVSDTVSGAVAPSTLSFAPPTCLLSHQVRWPFGFVSCQLAIPDAFLTKIAMLMLSDILSCFNHFCSLDIDQCEDLPHHLLLKSSTPARYRPPERAYQRRDHRKVTEERPEHSHRSEIRVPFTCNTWRSSP